jgi:hypothetical protein
MVRKFCTGAAGPSLGVIVAIAVAVWVALGQGG